VDYGETLLLRKRLDIVRVVLALRGSNRWAIYLMDAKLCFLNDILEEEVYVNQTHEYENRGKST